VPDITKATSARQALTRLTGEFRKEQTRFLNKVEAQKDRKVGGTLGIVESESQVGVYFAALL
jgi:hypothetical protein